MRAMIINSKILFRFTFIELLLLVGLELSAQQQSLNDIKDQLDIMFSELDKTKVPTGFLWDVSVNLVEGDSYNGSALTDTNFVSLSVMGEMLHSINSASVGADTICVQAALSRLKRNSSSQSVMVGILFQPYNYIVSNALTDNLISYSNDCVSDVYVNGIWQNPYGEDVLFGFAVGNDGDVDQTLTFTFANIDSLSTQTFQSIQFDPGDGNGFRTVSIGGTLNVQYYVSSNAYVETILKVSVGGQTYQSHSLLRVVCPNAVPDALSSYVDSLVIGASYEGRTYHARLVYDSSVAFNKRPLIVAEGFDPWRLTEGTTHPYSGFTDIEDIMYATDNTTLIFGNYDLFYIDWYDCDADIRANAEILKEVIRWVNNHNQSGEPNIVMGQSMGGLISRYALRDMEIHNESHNTTLFISHDVPYLGANVSPGLQYLYWDIQHITKYVLPFFDPVTTLLSNVEIDEINRIGGYQSVKQMLKLYMDSTWNYYPDEYNSLMNILSQMGFPRGDSGSAIENIAIVNGGDVSSLSNGYVDGNKLFYVQRKFSALTLFSYLPLISALFQYLPFPLKIYIPSASTVNFEWAVFPFLSNATTMYSASLTLTKKFLWKQPETIPLYSKIRLTPSAGICLDSVQSSTYHLPIESTLVNYNILDLFATRVEVAEDIPFVPIASAMVMPNDYSRDFKVNKPTPRTQTPFDSYILPASTDEHINFYSGISSWLNKIVNNHISGPDMVFSGDVFTIVGPDSSSFSWSTSDDSIATINPSGELTVLRNGVVDIIGTATTSNGLITKRKTVVADMLQMVLDYSTTSNGYLISSDYVSQDVENFINTNGLRDSLRFKWQLNTGNSIQTVVDTSRTFTAVVDSLVSFASVTFSVLYNGHESAQSSVILRNPDKYTHNVISIRHNGNGTSYYCLNVHYPYVYPVPFRIWMEGPLGYLLPNPLAPWKIKALGETFEGDIVFVNNIPCMEFDLFTDDDVIDFISSVTESNPTETLFVYICDSGENVEQVVQIPILCLPRL